MSKALIFLFFFNTCFGVLYARKSTAPIDTGREFYNKEFKWRMLIPQGFDTLSASQYADITRQGVKGLQKVSHDSITAGTTKICAYKCTLFNYFEVNYFHLDSSSYKGFYVECKTDDDDVYRYYKSILSANLKMDTAISSEIIGGLQFRKFELHVSFNNNATKNNLVNMYVYSRLFKQEEFSMVIVYADEKKGRMILDAWRNSKFDQKE